LFTIGQASEAHRKAVVKFEAMHPQPHEYLQILHDIPNTPFIHLRGLSSNPKMAELLGVVASGIGIASLVIQVFDSITKIKSFCNAMKEVPEEIQYLIEEIEALGLVLDDISSMHSKDECDSRSFDKCISLCRRGADILDTAVKEMSSQIEKQKRIGAFKAVMKRGQVEKLRERLRSAQFLLMLSHQAYSE